LVIYSSDSEPDDAEVEGGVIRTFQYNPGVLPEKRQAPAQPDPELPKKVPAGFFLEDAPLSVLTDLS
jgi:hypothetical protein